MPRSSTPHLPASALPATARLTPARVLAALTALALLAWLGAQAVPAQAAPPTVTPGPAIEELSPYQGQTICDPVVREGTAKLRELVLASYPGTGDAGTVRACDVGGASEHKEGRAWDWRVSVDDPAQVKQVDDLLRWLLATDVHGNTAAMARRLGVMYVIWNGEVWKSYQAAKGWQPYAGADPHTDHVHVSLSWAGAYGETSYWTGEVAPVMYAPQPALDPRQERRRDALDRLPGPWRRH